MYHNQIELIFFFGDEAVQNNQTTWTGQGSGALNDMPEQWAAGSYNWPVVYYSVGIDFKKKKFYLLLKIKNLFLKNKKKYIKKLNN